MKRIEVLAIGNELLDGRVADTNTLRLARSLGEVGVGIAQRTTVPDEVEVIVREAHAIIARGTDLCVVSGGLGPTADDVTSEALADLAGVELERDADQVARIEGRFQGRGRPLTPNQLKQADRPRGAEIVANPLGTAPGFALEVAGCRFVCLPGIPSEFDSMCEKAIIAPLGSTRPPWERFLLKSFGLVEGEVDQRLSELAERWPEVRVGYRSHLPEIHVTLGARLEHREALEGAREFTRTALGSYLFAEEDISLAAVVVQMLRERRASLATAESCSGGLIGDLVTDVPGSSDVFLLSVVAYQNEMKEQLLGVTPATLAAYGAVSEETVRQMARGVSERAASTYGLAISGIAGPGGGTPDKPVGTIWIAGYGPDLDQARKISLPFDRRRNKVIGAHAALDLLRRTLRPGGGQ